MSRQRSVSTSIWSKSRRFRKCNPIDRYLFLYLITNHDTELCGAYEQDIDDIVHFTGLTSDRVSKGFQQLEKAGLAKYDDGWIVIPKYIEQAKVDNPNVRKGIERSMSLLPERIAKALKGFERNTVGFADLDLDLDLDHKKERAAIPKLVLHLTLGVSMNQKRYNTLSTEWSPEIADEYMQRVIDYATAHDKKYKCYASAAAGFIARDVAAGKLVKRVDRAYKRPDWLPDES